MKRIVLMLAVMAAAFAVCAVALNKLATQETAAVDRSIETKVNDLLSKMTLEEKLQQVQLLADWQATDAQAKAGVGAVFSLTDPAKINHLQHVAVEESRLHIPILFAFDTIHG